MEITTKYKLWNSKRGFFDKSWERQVFRDNKWIDVTVNSKFERWSNTRQLTTNVGNVNNGEIVAEYNYGHGPNTIYLVDNEDLVSLEFKKIQDKIKITLPDNKIIVCENIWLTDKQKAKLLLNNIKKLKGLNK